MLTGLFCAALGAVNIVLSLPLIPRWVRARRGVRATGTVTGATRASWWGGRAAVVRLETEGRSVEVEALPASADEWPVGEVASIRYPPGRPECGVLWTPGEAFRTWGGLAVGGTLVGFAAAIVVQVR
ncbi:hypothetical protein [Gemmata obscuriglobus]|uniref:hypothetical protein n=1 Tax=Gemmata obscuriglobus TaxID=114 RepID=UPI0002FDC2FD|nr:hypothetical protein [Gemmata obscuriglobus]